jgi:hypothetical protein
VDLHISFDTSMRVKIHTVHFWVDTVLCGTWVPTFGGTYSYLYGRWKQYELLNVGNHLLEYMVSQDRKPQYYMQTSLLSELESSVHRVENFLLKFSQKKVQFVFGQTVI